MNGTIQAYLCSSCGESNTYGGVPKHNATCMAADYARTACRDCKHVSAIHVVPWINKRSPSAAGTWGCNYSGCKCELDYVEAMKQNVQSEVKKILCECGATKANGIPFGSILHSHFGFSDPSRWCPARQGAKVAT